MSVEEAIGKWSECAHAVELNGQIIRDGNWQTLARSLRHSKGGDVEEHSEKLNGDTVLVVTPKEPEGDPPVGKTRMVLPPFMLVVK